MMNPSDERGNAQLDDLIAALHADARTALDRAPHIGVYDTALRAWVAESEVGFDEELVEGFDMSARYVAVVAGSVFTVEGDATALAIELASQAQDHVIDETGRGWPEVHENGHFVGVLEPGIDATGRKGWMLRGYLVAAFGDLSTVTPPSPSHEGRQIALPAVPEGRSATPHPVAESRVASFGPSGRPGRTKTRNSR